MSEVEARSSACSAGDGEIQEGGCDYAIGGGRCGDVSKTGQIKLRIRQTLAG